MATYLLIDSNNKVINAIEYDGISEYPLEDNCSLILFDEEIRPWIGWTFNNGEWIMPDDLNPPTNPHKNSAIQKLSSLGLTQEEIDAFIGE